MTFIVFAAKLQKDCRKLNNHEGFCYGKISDFYYLLSIV